MLSPADRRGASARPPPSVQVPVLSPGARRGVRARPGRRRRDARARAVLAAGRRGAWSGAPGRRGASAWAPPSSCRCSARPAARRAARGQARPSACTPLSVQLPVLVAAAEMPGRPSRWPCSAPAAVEMAVLGPAVLVGAVEARDRAPRGRRGASGWPPSVQVPVLSPGAPSSRPCSARPAVEVVGPAAVEPRALGLALVRMPAVGPAGRRGASAGPRSSRPCSARPSACTPLPSAGAPSGRPYSGRPAVEVPRARAVRARPGGGRGGRLGLAAVSVQLPVPVAARVRAPRGRRAASAWPPSSRSARPCSWPPSRCACSAWCSCGCRCPGPVWCPSRWPCSARPAVEVRVLGPCSWPPSRRVCLPRAQRRSGQVRLSQTVLEFWAWNKPRRKSCTYALTPRLLTGSKCWPRPNAGASASRQRCYSNAHSTQRKTGALNNRRHIP